MKVRLGNKALYNFKSDVRAILEKHVGELIDVETEHLFDNQYNVTIDGCGIRLMDRDITEVVDDIRDGVVTCAYCGKQYKTLEEYNQHIEDLKNDAFKNCESCWWYQYRIIDTKHESETVIAENGDEIEKRTTIYTSRKSCTHSAEKYKCECEKLAHSQYKPRIMTKENTYFLKYPKGYNFYLSELSIEDAYKEKGFKQLDNSMLFVKYGVAGTYNLTVSLDQSGIIQYVTLANNKKSYVIAADTIKDFLSGDCYAHYYFGVVNKEVFDNFPKTYKGDLIKFCNQMRDAYMRNETIKAKFFRGI